MSVLQVGVQAPPGATCLSFAFRFLSEEPTNLASAYGDAFIAELDESTWTTSGSAISAPRDFALGPGGRVISVNGLGVAATSAAGAAGTRFDSGTAILRASAPVTPGPHTLYLSLLDQGGGDVDSAVLIDRLQFTATPAGGCAGAVVDDGSPLINGTPGGGIGSALTAVGGAVLPAGTAGALGARHREAGRRGRNARHGHRHRAGGPADRPPREPRDPARVAHRRAPRSRADHRGEQRPRRAAGR